MPQIPAFVNASSHHEQLHQAHKFQISLIASGNERSSSALVASYCLGLQISKRSRSPTNTASFSIPTALAIDSGRQIRPALSKVTRSEFLPRFRRNVCTSGSEYDMAFTLSTNARHASGPSTNKHDSLSSPFGCHSMIVNSNSASAGLHFAGI